MVAFHLPLNYTGDITLCNWSCRQSHHLVWHVASHLESQSSSGWGNARTSWPNHTLFAIPEEQVSLKTYPYIVKYFIFHFQDKSISYPLSKMRKFVEDKVCNSFCYAWPFKWWLTKRPFNGRSRHC